MLKLTVIGQTLKLQSPEVYEGSFAYLKGAVTFTGDWNGTTKYVHFYLDATHAYDVEMDEQNRFGYSEGDNISLSAGTWKLWIDGYTVDDDGVATKVITTGQVDILCKSTGSGFPSLQLTLVEKGVLEMKAIRDEVKGYSEEIIEDAEEIIENIDTAKEAATSASASASSAASSAASVAGVVAAAEAAKVAAQAAQTAAETAKGEAESSKNSAQGYSSNATAKANAASASATSAATSADTATTKAAEASASAQSAANTLASAQTQIDSAKTAAIGEVNSTKTAAITAVNAAKDAGISEINDLIATIPEDYSELSETVASQSEAIDALENTVGESPLSEETGLRILELVEDSLGGYSSLVDLVIKLPQDNAGQEIISKLTAEKNILSDILTSLEEGIRHVDPV